MSSQKGKANQFQSALSCLYLKIGTDSIRIKDQDIITDSKSKSRNEHDNKSLKKDQIEYGEVTKRYMTNIITFMQHITDLVPPEKIDFLIDPVEKYNISTNSRFLDTVSHDFTAHGLCC